MATAETLRIVPEEQADAEDTAALVRAAGRTALLLPGDIREEGHCIFIVIPATSWPDKLPTFGQDISLGRAGQPAELAPTYVFLASPEASYISGALVPVTGGKGF
nr:putative oxidoreductase YghA [Cryobacterium sp. SO1]